MRGRAFAWANLGYRMVRHLAGLPLRPLLRRGGAEEFLEAVAPEGYLPLSPAERALFPGMLRCVSCGLCALAGDEHLRSPHSAWDEPWTFVVGPSRSIDEARLAARSIPRDARSAEPEAVCPTGVPISEIAALVERLGRATEGGMAG